MTAQPIPQLFGLIPTGSPCITQPTTAPTQTSFLYVLPLSPSTKPFSHITVFLLPGITLPPDTAAAVYISLPQNDGAESFKFLGGIGVGKESAVFKVSGLLSPAGAGAGAGGGAGESGSGEVDMDAPTTATATGEITVGISLESVRSVSAQMTLLYAPSAAANTQALVLARNSAPANKPDTLVLAQRIIKNAFNFLASFSGNVNGGIEVVPLKAFEEWWKKFEGRVRSDPGFLERSDGD